jgi:hypothetical protein
MSHFLRVLLIASTLVGIGSAHAGESANGKDLNGWRLNGVTLNGLSINRLAFNGTKAGTPRQQFNGVALRDVSVR